MANIQKNKDSNFKIEIGLGEGKEWSNDKLAGIKAFIKEESNKITPEQKLKSEILAIKYQMEEYLENNEIDARQLSGIDKFLNAYLKVLNITFKKFATTIDTTDGNLKKYLSGDRKFNIDLAMKFGNFFHTPPDLWLKIQIKNELIELSREKTRVSRYKKYDYKKVLQAVAG